MTILLEILNSSFFPTVVVASFLGYLTYRQQRAGQRDTVEMQQKADVVSETQNAMQAYKNLYETEHELRLEIQADLKLCRELVRKDFEAAVSSVPVRSPTADITKSPTTKELE